MHQRSGTTFLCKTLLAMVEVLTVTLEKTVPAEILVQGEYQKKLLL